MFQMVIFITTVPTSNKSQLERQSWLAFDTLFTASDVLDLRHPVLSTAVLNATHIPQQPHSEPIAFDDIESRVVKHQGAIIPVAHNVSLMFPNFQLIYYSVTWRSLENHGERLRGQIRFS